MVYAANLFSVQFIASALEKLQPALFRRAGSIAPPLGPPRRAEVEHWDEAVRCLSVDPVPSGCVVYMGRVQYNPGWLYRVLKKTLHLRGALHYQVNYRQ